jgi:diaminohydroxyphosphoribosylaminopyrimidine deaminase / 5-amino-6-(5-phosphoribosylamino)uracil reductase
MQRCLELAELGRGNVAPNPMVGAVLVYEDRIIGEGYHQQYGKAHAEVNCIASVEEADRHLISNSVMYVSLEPCAHFGKTPPCADLIIKHKIPKVVVGCRDPFKEVDGKGIEKIKAAGIEVEVGMLEKECRDLNKRFFTFHTRQRPYIILKWAQTSDKKIATGGNKRFLISNEYSNRLVHKWRSEEAAILIGTNTALLDNPELTTRLWPGHSPVRLVLDMNLRLPINLKVFNKEIPTIIFNSIREGKEGNLQYYRLNKDENIIRQLMNALYKLSIQSVLVEGGARLLQSFIDEGVWDEVRVITNQHLKLNGEGENNNGLAAPTLKNTMEAEVVKLHGDIVEIFKPKEKKKSSLAD